MRVMVAKIEWEGASSDRVRAVTRGDPNPVNRASSLGLGSFRGGSRDNGLLGGGTGKREAWSIVRRGIG